MKTRIWMLMAALALVGCKESEPGSPAKPDVEAAAMEYRLHLESRHYTRTRLEEIEQELRTEAEHVGKVALLQEELRELKAMREEERDSELHAIAASLPAERKEEIDAWAAELAEAYRDYRAIKKKLRDLEGKISHEEAMKLGREEHAAWKRYNALKE